MLDPCAPPSRPDYSEKDWLGLASGLEDPIRERRRDARIEYLLINPGDHTWSTADDLFDYLLLDVQIGSCARTSRTVQATVAIQLFVQRCLMNLEPDVIPDSTTENGWTQWQSWMSSKTNSGCASAGSSSTPYPSTELRTNKSQFRSEFEERTNQHENEQRERRDRLQALSGTRSHRKKLDIRGMRIDRTVAAPAGLLPEVHVVARSSESPPRFDHQHTEWGRWIPWKTINADIKSDSVAPVLTGGSATRLAYRSLGEQSGPIHCQTK